MVLYSGHESYFLVGCDAVQFDRLPGFREILSTVRMKKVEVFPETAFIV